MNSTSEDRRLGDYLLKEPVAENPVTSTWLAEQVSVRRPVLVEILRSGEADSADAFIADARAKAAVDHSLFASIYEAVARPGLYFHAREHLPGTPFAALAAAGETLSPAKLTHFLRRIAAAQLHLEHRGIAADPLNGASIRFDPNTGLRLDNPALAGPRDPGRSAEDIAFLGSFLPALVAAGQPAAGRLIHVLAWMRGEDAPGPVGWEQVHDYCTQIEQQLAAPGGRAPRSYLPLLLFFVAFAILAVAFFRNSSPEGPPVPASEPPPPPKTVAAGEYPAPDGLEASLSGFSISARPVTVGEYAAFLQTLAVLTGNQRERTFDHRDQPLEKSGHEPDGWAALQTGDPDAPVTGVDWWDAVAYATWKKARLPTQEQWFAAFSSSPGPSLSEWTAGRAPNPANPAGEALWVLVKSTGKSPQREWTADRSLRRPGLGFRVVWEED